MPQRTSQPRRGGQLLLPISFVRNRGLFSNHWFERRLRSEPEWDGFREHAATVLERISEIWARERERVERYPTEGALEHSFIQPILNELGWKSIYQTYLPGGRPDYALFLDDAAKDASLTVDPRSLDFWQHSAIVADAKAWNVPLSRPSLVNQRREFPPEQIERYLDRSRNEFGILTNGKLWRLIPRAHASHQRRFQTYLECDLTGLLEELRNSRSITERAALAEEFLEFFLFFSPTGYIQPDRPSLIQRAIEGSSEYRVGVGEGLKERAFEALRLCIEGFLKYAPNGLRAATINQCRDKSFILLYRLLFIMYAEDRRLLPYRTNRLYTDNRSLGRRRAEIAGELDRVRIGMAEDYSTTATDIWDDLQTLFDLVDRGDRRYGVPKYNGGLFDRDAHEFLNTNKVSDRYMAQVIDQLGRALDPLEPEAGLSMVDYRDLAIQHLGGIYEGLLELKPVYASERTAVVSRRREGRLEEKYWQESEPFAQGWTATERVYPRGTVYLRTSKNERRASGSYYTPDHIVDYIVDRTLGPVCKAVSEELDREITAEQGRLQNANGDLAAQCEATLERLKSDFDDRILRLRILDPAMGSGHFLLRACQRLAEEIATHPYSRDEQEEESSVSYWKRRVVEHCLYGVDLNPLAVELAKLGLWLETVATDKPLTFLDHHLHQGNSLVGAMISEMGTLPDEPEIWSERFREQFSSKLTTLLGPLERIRDMPSNTAEQVKEKDRLYKEFEKLREPFRRVGDLWCSTFCDDIEISPEQYQSVIEALNRPRRFASIVNEARFRTALTSAETQFVRCFHWELEFPEAYFDGTQRKENSGFDAVIGNPPYDVLSELEGGRDLTAFRAFIDGNAVYDPSREGKNNLYKLFICRALELLRNGGHFGFITPMAVLGDKIAKEIRRKIVEVGSFTGIEAFPQKDNPPLRIFPEAKLSTAIFIVEKGLAELNASRPFVARVHPGRLIEAASPQLALTTDAIPLYDPSNFTIVSCSQSDWDLATRLMRTGRMVRLQTAAEFFQGEVNETNEGARGSFTDDPHEGQLVTRGASICLYVAREASQGNDLHLNVQRFLDGKGEDTKAFHHRYARVCLQESSPQNNFRRIIAALIPAGHFCNHKINYLPEHKSQSPLEFALALLNSKLADWYFRLGSTNAAVSHYQLYNLPCPHFADAVDETDEELKTQIATPMRRGRLADVYDLLTPHLDDAPFRLAIRDTIIVAVKKIISIERDRGEISRTARSALAPSAQPFQDLIDRLFYALAGLTAEEAVGLEVRLAQML